jgi:hypothetical protein
LIPKERKKGRKKERWRRKIKGGDGNELILECSCSFECEMRKKKNTRLQNPP